MDKETHKEIHRKLHNRLDELVADWIRHTQSFPSKSTVLELMQWSEEQCENPSDDDD